MRRRRAAGAHAVRIEMQGGNSTTNGILNRGEQTVLNMCGVGGEGGRLRVEVVSYWLRADRMVGSCVCGAGCVCTGCGGCVAHFSLRFFCTPPPPPRPPAAAAACTPLNRCISRAILSTSMQWLGDESRCMRKLRARAPKKVNYVVKVYKLREE